MDLDIVRLCQYGTQKEQKTIYNHSILDWQIVSLCQCGFRNCQFVSIWDLPVIIYEQAFIYNRSLDPMEFRNLKIVKDTVIQKIYFTPLLEELTSIKYGTTIPF